MTTIPQRPPESTEELILDIVMTGAMHILILGLSNVDKRIGPAQNMFRQLCYPWQNKERDTY